MSEKVSWLFYLFVQAPGVLSQKTRCSSEQCSKVHGDDAHGAFVLSAHNILTVSFVPEDVAIDWSMCAVFIGQHRETDVCSLQGVHFQCFVVVLHSFYLYCIKTTNFFFYYLIYKY